MKADFHITFNILVIMKYALYLFICYSADVQGNRMELMEREIARFREVIPSQAEIMQEAKHEIKQLKDTIQRQAQDMIDMKKKLNRQEGIIIKQGLKLKNQDKDVKELKLSVQNQEKQKTILEKQISTLKRAFIKQDLKARNHFLNTKEFNNHQTDKLFKTGYETEMELTRSTKDIFDGADKPDEDNTKEFSQDLTKDNSLKDMETKVVQNMKPSNYRSAGFKRWNNNTGIAFSAYLGHSVYHMGIGHTIKCDQVLINDGNAYSPYTGTFTVPETAVYFLTFHIDALTKDDETIVKLVVNNRNIVDADAQVRGITHHAMAGNAAIIRLNSGEKVWLEIYTYDNVELISSSTHRFVTFSGYMLY